MRIRLPLVSCLAAAACVANPVGADRDTDALGAAPEAGGVGGPPELVPDRNGDASLDPASDGTTPAADHGCETENELPRGIDSATKLGDTLYVQPREGPIQAWEATAQRLVPKGDLPALDGAPGDRGLAHLRELAPGLYVRLVTGADGQARVDAVDMTSPRSPQLRGSVFVGPAPGAFAVAQGRVHVCAGEDLALIGFGEPDSPTLDLTTSAFCRPSDGRAAEGAAAISFRHGQGALVPAYQLYLARGDGLEQVFDHGFNPSGAHQYGDVVGLAIGARRAIVDVQNVRNFFLIDLEQVGGWLYDAALDVGAEARPLGFVDDWLLFSEGLDLYAWDLSDPLAPRRVPGSWPHAPAGISGVPFDAALLFADAEAFGVRNAYDGLSVFSRHGDSPWLVVSSCEP